MKVSDLTPNEENPRIVTPEKLEMLKKAMLEFGDLSGVVFNKKTHRLVGGHQRKEILSADSEVTITKTYEKPTKLGTTAVGYILIKGERFSYREVNWSEQKEKAANIAANKGAGEWDIQKLSKWMKDLKNFDTDFDMGLTMFDNDELVTFLQDGDVTRVNNGDENSEWAKMGEEHEFVRGKDYCTLVIHFKNAKLRDNYCRENKITLDKKLKTAWIASIK